MTARHDGIHLAEGFHFTDHLVSPYRIVYGHIKAVGRGVYISNIAGTECRTLLEAGEIGYQSQLCFSPDGNILYVLGEHIQATEIATGAVQTLPKLPLEPPYERTYLLDCSPDNRTLLLSQGGKLPETGSHFSAVPSRFYCISTDGDNLRVLVESSSDTAFGYAATCWENNFVFVYRYCTATGIDGSELCKLDLDTGHLTRVCLPPETWRYGGLSFNGEEIVWETPGQELYTCSLTECVTRKLPVAGSLPEWSPNGKQIAFVQDRSKVCLWDTERQREQYIIGFALSNRIVEANHGFLVRRPVWSPDGQMLWFEIARTRNTDKEGVVSEVISKPVECLQPLSPPPKRKWTDFLLRWRHPEPTSLMGIADLSTQQVMLYNGWLMGGAWLPQSKNAT